MNKIWIIGLGPGHEDYILPIAKKKISSADIVIGGKRHLESIDTSAEKFILRMPLSDSVNYIKENYKKKQVAVIVSGDTGFYSLLDYLKKNFSNNELLCFPGISSLQYLFSKLNMSYKEAFIGSVHGRDLDLKDLLLKYKILGLLTDQKMTPSKIAKEIISLNLNGKLHIGENLSYDNECVKTFEFKEVLNKEFNKLCVVVIEIE